MTRSASISPPPVERRYRFPERESKLWYLIPSLDVVALLAALAVLGFFRVRVPAALRWALVAGFVFVRLFRIAAYLKSDDAEAAHMVGVTRIVLAQKAWQRGDLALARNLIKEATADIQRSMQLNPDNPRVKNNMEYARQLAQRIEMGPPPRPATRTTQPATQP